MKFERSIKAIIDEMITPANMDPKVNPIKNFPK
jgi:hypothetical protein